MIQRTNFQALTITTLLLISLFLFNSCTKEKVQEINDYMEQIDSTGSDTSSSIDSIVVQYPSLIEEYVTKHHSTTSIIQVIFDEKDGVYQVTLSDKTILIFDETGNFLFEEDNNNQTGNNEDDGDDDEDDDDEDEEEEEERNSSDITVDDLPSVIKDFISEHYPGVGIASAEVEYNGNYEVELETGAELYFDADGNIIYVEYEDHDEWDEEDEEMDVSISSLPQAIIDYIVANYPNVLIAQADMLADGEGYKVRLSNDMELYFDNNGNFVRIETEFRLAVTSIEFPDTVTIGEQVEMKVYITNQNINPFNGDLEVPYGVADEQPTTLDGTIPSSSKTILNVQLDAGESRVVSLFVPVDNGTFNPSTHDIVIVWPDVITPTAIDAFVLNGGHGQVKTYVKP